MRSHFREALHNDSGNGRGDLRVSEPQLCLFPLRAGGLGARLFRLNVCAPDGKLAWGVVPILSKPALRLGQLSAPLIDNLRVGLERGLICGHVCRLRLSRSSDLIVFLLRYFFSRDKEAVASQIRLGPSIVRLGFSYFGGGGLAVTLRSRHSGLRICYFRLSA